MVASRTADRLLDQIAAQPDDDQVRRVYADHLIERGDPRGEFIMLQLSRKNPARARSLLNTHWERWLDPITPFVHNFRFERGFLVEAHLCEHLPGTGDRCPGFAASSDDRIWSTVTHLAIVDDSHLPLLHAPRFRAVRHLAGLTHRSLRELLGWDEVPFITLNAFLPDPDADVATNKVAFESLLASQAKLAKLRELQFYGCYAKPSEFRWLWKTWLGKQLESVGVDSGMVHFGAWIRELDRLPKSLRTLKVSDQDVWIEWLELARDPSGRFSTIEVRASRPDFVRHGVLSELAALERGPITTVRFVEALPQKCDRAYIEEACARSGITLELPKSRRR